MQAPCSEAQLDPLLDTRLRRVVIYVRSELPPVFNYPQLWMVASIPRSYLQRDTPQQQQQNPQYHRATSFTSPPPPYGDVADGGDDVIVIISDSEQDEEEEGEVASDSELLEEEEVEVPKIEDVV